MQSLGCKDGCTRVQLCASAVWSLCRGDTEVSLLHPLQPHIHKDEGYSNSSNGNCSVLSQEGGQPTVTGGGTAGPLRQQDSSLQPARPSHVVLPSEGWEVIPPIPTWAFSLSQ